jgi:hypothetical protein
MAYDGNDDLKEITFESGILGSFSTLDEIKSSDFMKFDPVTRILTISILSSQINAFEGP